MLEYKGLQHDVVTLPSGLHPLFLRTAGFQGRTVPALRVGERRILGSMAISRFLDEFCPVPPLFPPDPEARRQVEEAEAWGESVLQPVPRRLVRWALVRAHAVRRMLARENHLPIAGAMAVAMMPLAAYFARYSSADDGTVRRHLADLPSLAARVGELLEAGVIGAHDPNAATFQIAPSLRFLMNFDQLEPLLRDLPAGRFARELLPEYPGRVGRVFPREWLEPGSTGSLSTALPDKRPPERNSA